MGGWWGDFTNACVGGCLSITHAPNGRMHARESEKSRMSPSACGVVGGWRGIGDGF